MPCSRTEHLLREYFADDLPSVMRAEIEQHVADCPDCAAELRHLHGAAHSLGQWRELPTPRWDRHLALFRGERADASQGWRFLWQWLPATACALMFGLLLLNTSVLYRAGTLEISFGNPLSRNADDFAGRLAEALGLETAADPFNLTAERIHSSYLAGRGLVLEVRSNLATANRFNPAIPDSPGAASLQDGNPSAMLAPTNLQQTAAEPDRTAFDARRPHRDLLLRASEINTAELVNSAIIEAGEYARILRDADGVGRENFEQLREEIETLRRQNLAVSDRLRDLTEELRRSTTTTENESFQTALDTITEEMNRLRSQAQDLAADLRRRSESAQASRAERWRNEVAALEQRLASALCDQGARLRQLPERENITIVLTGLGEPTPARPATDLIHTYARSDLLQCANGAIDPATLEERSNPYSN